MKRIVLVVDAMGVLYESADDVAELLVPFVNENGGESDPGAIERQYLEASDIPYYAFRSEVPGKATAAHIHIGPPSTRLPAHSGV